MMFAQGTQCDAPIDGDAEREEALRHIRAELETLMVLSKKHDLSMLHYMLEMAHLETALIIDPASDPLSDVRFRETEPK